jgi:hypothetical protein
MRGWLIFLAFAIPLVLASPMFWSILNMNFGAAPVAYGYANGVVQDPTIGPASPWPDWALKPEGARLTPRSNSQAAPGQNALGLATIDDAPGSAGAVIARYERAMEAAGWMVTLSEFRTLSPDAPPKPLHYCILEARSGPRVVRLSMQDDAAPMSGGTLWWSIGEVRPLVGATPGACEDGAG